MSHNIRKTEIHTFITTDELIDTRLNGMVKSINQARIDHKKTRLGKIYPYKVTLLTKDNIFVIDAFDTMVNSIKKLDRKTETCIKSDYNITKLKVSDFKEYITDFIANDEDDVPRYF